MDICSKGNYPSNMLSNFASHEFEIDGVQCGSMEGFLQSLKYRNAAKQKAVCALSGTEAKAAGSKKWLWKRTHNVWWRGQKIKRNSDNFAKLIDRAYMKLSKNLAFAKALCDSGKEELTHVTGGHDPFKTILTEEEFVSQLMKVRHRLNKHENDFGGEPTIFNKAIDHDFGEGFLFSTKKKNVTEEDIKNYRSGTITVESEKCEIREHSQCSVMVYTGGYYSKVVRLMQSIPTFNFGDRANDSWHDLYLVQETSGRIYAVYCTGGYHIASIKGYDKVYRYPEYLNPYFAKD